jgi:hypothetical protein
VCMCLAACEATGEAASQHRRIGDQYLFHVLETINMLRPYEYLTQTLFETRCIHETQNYAETL